MLHVVTIKMGQVCAGNNKPRLSSTKFSDLSFVAKEATIKKLQES